MITENKAQATRTSVGNYLAGDLIFLSYWLVILGSSSAACLHTSWWLFPVYFYLCLLIIGFLLPKPSEGRFSLKSKQATLWFLHFQFGRVWNYPPIKHLLLSFTLLRTLFFRACGAKASMNIGWSANSDIIDLSMLTIESHAIVGAKATITGHIIAKGEIILKKVVLKEGCLVGGHCLIAPGVYVGRDATIEPNCIILPNSVIPDFSYIGASSVIKAKMKLENGKKYPSHLSETTLQELTK